MKTDVGAAKPTLSPFAKNKNLIELKVFFLVILHLDLCPGKVWEFSIFFILHTSRRNFWIAALNTDTSLIRTVHLVPERPKTDTSIMRTLIPVPLVSVIKRFDCSKNSNFFLNKKKKRKNGCTKMHVNQQ